MGRSSAARVAALNPALIQRVEGKIMGDIIAAGAVLTVLLLPVLWRASEDRAVARASIIRSDIDQVVRSALGGESLVAVEVRPSR